MIVNRLKRTWNQSVFTNSKSNKQIRVNAIMKVSDGIPTTNLQREVSQTNIRLSNFQQGTNIRMQSYTNSTLIREKYIQVVIKDPLVQGVPKTQTRTLLINHQILTGSKLRREVVNQPETILDQQRIKNTTQE